MFCNVLLPLNLTLFINLNDVNNNYVVSNILNFTQCVKTTQIYICLLFLFLRIKISIITMAIYMKM